MSMRTLFFSLLLFSTSAVAEEVFDSINAFEQKATDGRRSDFTIKSTSDDTTSNEIKDWAGIIYDTSGKGSKAQIYVLTQDDHGKYHVTGKSQPFDFIGRNQRSYVEDVEIADKNSFSIQVNSRSVCGTNADSFSFAQYQGKWRLSSEENLGRACDDQPYNDFNINFISGRVEVILYRNGQSIVKKLRRKFPAYTLQDFDFFENHEDEDLFEYNGK